MLILGLGNLVLAGVLLGLLCTSCGNPGPSADPSRIPHVYEMDRATCYVMYGNNGTQAISCVGR